MGRFSKRRSGPWYGEERARVLFEWDARKQFPRLRRKLKQLDGQRGCSYLVEVDVPYYETRRVEIFFGQYDSGGAPIILADGPTESPHRFSDFEGRQLCVWHHNYPRDQRWIFQDGLLHLLELIKLHLFREAWWRDTGCGEWPGPQALHNPVDKTRKIDQ